MEKGNKRWRMRIEERENENRREWEQERVKGLQKKEVEQRGRRGME